MKKQTSKADALSGSGRIQQRLTMLRHSAYHGREMVDRPKFTFKTRDGTLFTAPTAEDIVQLHALLKERDAKAAREQVTEYQKRAGARLAAKYGGEYEQMDAFMQDALATPWTPEKFLNFIDRLGSPQKVILAALVTRHRVTDEELRKLLKVSSNQALAGVLSGISKQAAALGIPARDIFEFENFRNAGKRRSVYTVADKFLLIANDMPNSLPSEK